MNFLVLRGLFKNYLNVDGLKETVNPLSLNADETKISSAQFDSGKELYHSIRHRLIDSVYKNWRLNHVFWEQYND